MFCLYSKPRLCKFCGACGGLLLLYPLEYLFEGDVSRVDVDESKRSGHLGFGIAKHGNTSYTVRKHSISKFGAPISPVALQRHQQLIISEWL